MNKAHRSNLRRAAAVSGVPSFLRGCVKLKAAAKSEPATGLREKYSFFKIKKVAVFKDNDFFHSALFNRFASTVSLCHVRRT